MNKIESRALELFAKGMFPFDVKDILLDEFPNVLELAIEIEIESAWILYKEKSIPDENNTIQ